MAQTLFIPGSQPESQRFDFMVKKKCYYNSHLNSETPSPIKIATYSLWLVYDLVARLELILQSSPSQCGSETYTHMALHLAVDTDKAKSAKFSQRFVV